MARVMTLDGLDPTRLNEIRAQLAQPELSWWHQPFGLGNPLAVARKHGVWIAGVLGVVLGALIANKRSR